MELTLLAFWITVLGIIILKKQLHLLPGFFIVVIIAMLMCFNTYNPDYATYEDFYSNILNMSNTDHGNDVLYVLVNKIGFFLKMDFRMFRSIYISICLLSLFCYATKHTKHIGLCMVMYFFTSGVFDYVQLRQFGALAIAIWIIDLLTANEYKKNFIKLIVLLICASGFHKSALLYMIFIPFFFLDLKKAKKIYAICLLLMLAIIYIALETPIVYLLMRKFAGEGTASYYLISNHYMDTIPKIVFDIFIQQGLLILIIYQQDKWNRKCEKNRHSVMAIFAIDCLIAAIMPLNILTIQFKRLSRITLIPSFAVALYSDKGFSRWKISMKDLKTILLLTMYVFLYCSLTLYANPTIISDLFVFFNKQ